MPCLQLTTPHVVRAKLRAPRTSHPVREHEPVASAVFGGTDFSGHMTWVLNPGLSRIDTDAKPPAKVLRQF